MSTPTTVIGIYADKAVTQSSGTCISLALSGIDTAQVIAEFHRDEVLDCYDVADIQTYLDERRKEDEE